eukprot:CAMPEP_0172307706 /NCGR_PEP_ID=MMETSP1058-20130122/8500_1 /TAXON_ID=83371 /ORGANISM="Detonula confervacea, Strain CCMP 353" /LENGTH=428 /DNA_ID=CAMNT_0013019943 /DNA_START=20 /DNA_END=1306 /DNA_ORIENTATION=-
MNNTMLEKEEETTVPLSESKGGDRRDDNLRRKDSLDYFDAMEVLYYDDMLQQNEESTATDSPSTSSSEEEDTFAKEGSGNDENEEQNIVHEIKGRVHHNRKKLHKMASEKRKILERKIKERRRKLKQIMSEPGFVMTMDKISFVCGVLIIMVIEAVLLVSPEKMGVLYSTLLIPLMVVRYILYRADMYHYFMYDFCYYAQVLLLVHMYKYPNNIELGKALFSISNGPLASAIIMWRNSLVFHSMDKMTSMFIHILPPLVMFSRRWGDHLANKDFPFYEDMDGTISSNIKDFMWVPLCYYGVWQIGYLVKTEVISKNKLEYNTGIMTSLRWMTRKRSSTSYKLLSIFGEHNQLPTFVLIQAVYTLATFLIMPLLWHSFWLHAFYLGVIFIVSLANGATYYFHVFAKRYIEEIGKRVSEEKTETKTSAKA